MTTISFQPTLSPFTAPPGTQPGKLRARLVNSGGIVVGGPLYQDPSQFGQPFSFPSVSPGDYKVELMRMDAAGISFIGAAPFMSENINIPTPQPVIVDVPAGGTVTVS